MTRPRFRSHLAVTLLAGLLALAAPRGHAADTERSQTPAEEDPQMWLVVVAMTPTADTFDIAGYTASLRRKYPRTWLPDYANWKAKNHQFAFYTPSPMHAVGVFEQTGPAFHLLLSSAEIRMVPVAVWPRVKKATLDEMAAYDAANPLPAP